MKMYEPIFKNARVGNKVWSIRCGWGIIKEIQNDYAYPISVQFNNTCNEYTISGRYLQNDLNPELYWEEKRVPKQVKKPFIEIDWMKVPIDTEVIVIPSHGKEVIRKFVCYLPSHPNNNFIVFSSGTNQNEATMISFYDNCKLADELNIPDEWYKHE